MKKLVSILMLVVFVFLFASCNEKEVGIIDELKEQNNIISVKKFELKKDSLDNYSAYNIKYKIKENNDEMVAFLSFPNDYKDRELPTFMYFPTSNMDQQTITETFTACGAVTVTIFHSGISDLGGEKELADTQFWYDIIKKLNATKNSNIYEIATMNKAIAALKFATTNDIKAISLSMPILDVAELYKVSNENWQKNCDNLFGGSPEQVPEKYDNASALKFAKDIKCPVLISNYDYIENSDIYINTSKKFVDILKKNGVKSRMDIYSEQLFREFSDDSLSKTLDWFNI